METVNHEGDFRLTPALYILVIFFPYSFVVPWLYFSVFSIEKVLRYSGSRHKELETPSMILGEGGSPGNISCVSFYTLSGRGNF